MQVTVRISKDLEKKLVGLEEQIEREVKEIVYDMAEYAIAISPVWSGAYVTSHSIRPRGSRSGRVRKSPQPWGLSTKVPESLAKQEANTLIDQDIAALDVLENDGWILINRAPHADAVERKHNVFGQVKARFK